MATHNPIPLYDATVPIACTADRSELDGRVEQIERMREHLEGVERGEHGLVLHFANRAGVEAEVRQFAADEKNCCQFWGFDIVAGERITLRWDGPPEVSELMDSLFAQFASDEPFTAFSSLL